ncbi:unnamed protein product [Cylindrotheca closterium]|uniref:Splicing factor 3A subunit 1 n=1 Tax=Cylindrotheca closterium TaxID=2856 RepID=A0AAD2JP21_9STRA|nr:unnamed protein product [Cylindrotheca closterium]
MVIAGVIRPPPDIRVVVDRTAAYVAKNGRAFEARILKSEKGRTPKFAFLQPSSPFHAYYEDRIRVYEVGGDEEPKESKEETSLKDEKLKSQDKAKQQSLVRKEKKQHATAIDPVAKAVLLHRGRITKEREKESSPAGKTGNDEVVRSEPTSLSIMHPLSLISIIAPSDLSSVQIETLQLVAQYAALDGKGGAFLHQLSVREWNNNHFAFCQPRHPHFAFFSAVVDAYSNIIKLWSAGDQVTMEENKTSVSHALDEAAYRAEYERAMARLDSNADEKGPGVDWHDFVVVETIDFPVDEVVELSMLPPPPPAPTTGGTIAYPTHVSELDEGETIRVVPSYTPRVVVPARLQETKAIDPITGKSISVADMPEHLRIQLLDPKWAKDKKKFQDKQKESNLVGGDAIAANITRFGGPSGASKFFDTGTQKSQMLEDGMVAAQASCATSQWNPSMHGTSFNKHSEGELTAIEPVRKRMRIAEEGNAPTTHEPSDYSSSFIQDAHGKLHLNNVLEATMTVNTDNELLSAEDFQASLGKPEVTVQVRIPNDPSQIAWNFYGQILSMRVHVMTKIKDVKSELSQRHLNGMPPNKIQLRDTSIGFLKDSSTLASLNMGPTATVEMIPKTRGGRK